MNTMPTTTAIMKIITPTKAKGEISPFFNISQTLMPALGKPATIPANISKDMPLPMPFSVILSPTHTRNMVEDTRAITVVREKRIPVSGTIGVPFGETCP